MDESTHFGVGNPSHLREIGLPERINRARTVYDHDLMDERGRGLGFIELLMDDVAINPSPGGTAIRFTKRLGN